ncbi:MAG TPA: aspartate/glutamate racemase family protein [Anaerolineae bacterium]|nr:aspartate/glutamate racemase family protein [Anaerolineae bacterium]
MPELKQLTILYTGLVPVPGMVALAKEILPDVRVVNIVDDSLLDDVLTAGGLTQEVTRRICQYALAAEDGGADVILSQCSSVGEAIDVARKLVHTPIVKIDEPMAEEALRFGSRVAVAATLPTTLDPTCRLIEHTARCLGKRVQIRRVLAEGAFDVLKAGDVAGHNAMVLREIRSVQGVADVIVLAQGSMAMLIPELEGLGVPVLASPRLGMMRVKQVLESI